MPAPVVTCGLVAALILGLAVPIAGIALALICAAVEFFLPTLES
jgi:uncharacterized oligopeptide transporter (OPT) family protein